MTFFSFSANILRKRLPAVKGGKLARLVAPAKILSLIVSDIVGDPVDMIASDPTILTNTSPQGNARSPLEILQQTNRWPSSPGLSVFKTNKI